MLINLISRPFSPLLGGGGGGVGVACLLLEISVANLRSVVSSAES